MGHFICCFACIEHLKKHHGINADHSIICSDDFLTRNIKHLLHHIHFLANTVDERDNQVQSRLGSDGKPAKPFDRIDITLFNNAHCHEQEDNKQEQQRDQHKFHGSNSAKTRDGNVTAKQPDANQKRKPVTNVEMDKGSSARQSGDKCR